MMTVDPGYYSYNIATERDTEDSLFRELLHAGRVKLAKTVLYQGGEMSWILFFVPKAFELGPLDSLAWKVLFREAEAESTPEDTVPPEELLAARDPVVELIEQVELPRLPKLGPSGWVVAGMLGAFGVGCLLMARRR